MRCTGVAKSVTLSGRCSAGEMLALPTLITTFEPCFLMSGTAPSPLKRMISLPEPPTPRVTSLLETASPPATCFAGSTATGTSDCAPATYDAAGAACGACTAPTSGHDHAMTPTNLDTNARGGRTTD